MEEVNKRDGQKQHPTPEQLRGVRQQHYFPSFRTHLRTLMSAFLIFYCLTCLSCFMSQILVQILSLDRMNGTKPPAAVIFQLWIGARSKA